MAKKLKNVTEEEKTKALYSILGDMSAVELMNAMNLEDAVRDNYEQAIEDEIREMRAMKELE